jgi:hypothetical protein
VFWTFRVGGFLADLFVGRSFVVGLMSGCATFDDRLAPVVNHG